MPTAYDALETILICWPILAAIVLFFE